MVWASDGRLVFVPQEVWDPVRVYDKELTEVAVWWGWASSRALAAGDQLVGLDQGVVLSAPVQGGPVVRFAELGDGLPGAIAILAPASGTGQPSDNLPTAVPTGAPATDPNGRDSAATIAALAAVLLAGTLLAAYSASKGRPDTKGS